MKIISTPSGVVFYTFPEPSFKNTIHGFFTRKGGISSTPYDSLNLSISTGDSLKNIHENRRRIMESINRSENSVYDVWQVHSNQINIAKEPRKLDREPEQADAIITNNPDLTLLMKFADCVPILVNDPVKKVVGIIHAGWQGTVKRIAEKTIECMANRFNSNPSDVHAIIGPSIGPDHYNVGEDVYKSVIESFGQDHDFCLSKQNGQIKLDLWKANELLLRQTGVKEICITGMCTACDIENWYSHRAENGITGRFAAVIALKG